MAGSIGGFNAHAANIVAVSFIHMIYKSSVFLFSIRQCLLHVVKILHKLYRVVIVSIYFENKFELINYSRFNMA